MNGLLVNITGYRGCLSFAQQTIQPSNGSYNTLFFQQCYEPAALADFIYQFGPAQQETKFYLRQMKNYGWIQNNSNVPIFLYRTTCYAKQRISVSDYSNLSLLISAGSVQVDSTWGVPATINTTAQRLLKFGRTKVIKMKGGAIHHYKLNKKFRSPKLITKSKEADQAYLLNKGTMFYMFKIIPAAIGAGANVTTLDPVPAPYNILNWGYEYVSGYVIGNEDPAVNLKEIPISNNPTTPEPISGHIYGYEFQHTPLKN